MRKCSRNGVAALHSKCREEERWGNGEGENFDELTSVKRKASSSWDSHRGVRCRTERRSGRDFFSGSERGLQRTKGEKMSGDDVRETFGSGLPRIRRDNERRDTREPRQVCIQMDWENRAPLYI